MAVLFFQLRSRGRTDRVYHSGTMVLESVILAVFLLACCFRCQAQRFIAFRGLGQWVNTGCLDDPFGLRNNPAWTSPPAIMVVEFCVVISFIAVPWPSFLALIYALLC